MHVNEQTYIISLYAGNTAAFSSQRNQLGFN